MNLFNGNDYQVRYEDYIISWESQDNYRFWCFMEYALRKKKESVLVIMFNPGSLSADGKNLLRDTTLRNLRNLFRDSSYNCLITNLYDLAAPKPSKLYENWNKKSSQHCLAIFDQLKMFKVKKYLWAYGDLILSNNSDELKENKDRIDEIQNKLNKHGLQNILGLTNKSGTPIHPMRYGYRYPNNKGEKTALVMMKNILIK